MPTTTAHLGLGSNLGDREANLKRALAMLVQSPHLEVRRIASFHDNPAVGGPDDAPPFLNTAAEIVTTLQPTALMRRLLDIEQEMGRQRREKWEPRVIDLDILLMGPTIVSTDSLIIPHPLMHERSFVLKPLAEIAPKAYHPTLGATVDDLLQNVGNAVAIEKDAD